MIAHPQLKLWTAELIIVASPNEDIHSGWAGGCCSSQLLSSVHSSPILIERQKADAWTLNCKYGMQCTYLHPVLSFKTFDHSSSTLKIGRAVLYKIVLVSLHFKRKRKTKIRIKTRIGNNCWVACRHLASSFLVFLCSSSSDTKFNDRCNNNNNILARQLLTFQIAYDQMLLHHVSLFSRSRP